MLEPVGISDTLLAELYALARAAFPDECCGYVLGERDARTAVPCRNAQADGLHPTHPARGSDTGFVIAGRELFDFARAFHAADAGAGRPLVVYHSHTNGQAYFSAVDRQNALSGDGAERRPVYPVQHLVIGVTTAGITEAALFAWRAAEGDEPGDFVEVARWDARC